MRCIVFGDHYRAANVPSAIWPFWDLSRIFSVWILTIQSTCIGAAISRCLLSMEPGKLFFVTVECRSIR